MYSEEDYLMISGLQHFSFCQRQWALIHIEQQWSENLRTVEGDIIHKRAHDSSIREVRGDTIVVRGVSVSSSTLGVSGQCDILEFHRDENGISLSGVEGLWQPYPVEYKRGKSKKIDADRLQLCCQTMCLEEMLLCSIPEGSLYYDETRKRECVQFSDELRKEVEEKLEQMHQLYNRGYTPRVKISKKCDECSLKELCLPELTKIKKVSEYISSSMEE